MRELRRAWRISIALEGLNIERFIRQAAEQGVVLTGMRRTGSRRLTAQVQESALPAVETLAVQGGWRLTVGRRYGLGRALTWLRARRVLCMGLLAAGVALFAATQVVWQVDIVDGGAYAADIRTALTDMGVTPPFLRTAVDLGTLRDALEWRYPRIAWFECGWRGGTLVIRAVEGVLPRQDGETEGACDVVATRDGIVHAIVTRAGTPAVTPGQIVRKGEVLIRGEERMANGEVTPVAAQGSVIARVWMGASVRMSAYETITRHTGAQQTVWTLRTPWFDLWQMAECPFAHYDVRMSARQVCSLFLPVTLYAETRLETEHIVQRRDQVELEADAQSAALRRLYEKAGGAESLIDIWGNCSMIDDENVLSVAIGEMHVEIGTQRPTGMTASGGEDES